MDVEDSSDANIPAHLKDEAHCELKEMVTEKDSKSQRIVPAQMANKARRERMEKPWQSRRKSLKQKKAVLEAVHGQDELDIEDGGPSSVEQNDSRRKGIVAAQKANKARRERMEKLWQSRWKGLKHKKAVPEAVHGQDELDAVQNQDPLYVEKDTPSSVVKIEIPQDEPESSNSARSLVASTSALPLIA
ncbi:unnamed protein product [Bursaphelenchus okinawaensis]|uniref:Uncharacterized protein n=1 Tax=Bursaphelenchus okinawaensis TaxID=465554 RepID=A0A811JVV1_9BILA|nr:unnamed protein product [Bursaphelenchus okinawaensis]CAG9085441.1 unnamed protein product [Bursaphelenchus okinawaensis]